MNMFGFELSSGSFRPCCRSVSHRVVDNITAIEQRVFMKLPIGRKVDRRPFWVARKVLDGAANGAGRCGMVYAATLYPKWVNISSAIVLCIYRLVDSFSCRV